MPLEAIAGCFIVMRRFYAFPPGHGNPGHPARESGPPGRIDTAPRAPPSPEMTVSADLYWIPVGAGTRFQRASLLLYESVAAAIARRPRRTLLHAALKLSLEGRHYTLELMPAPPGPNLRGEVTGPVGIRGADRLRMFRYQACLRDSDTLPDEQWAAGAAIRLCEDAATVTALIAATRRIPAYTWGRRRKGHSEMWTSNSCVAWLLFEAGLDAHAVAIPGGGRAPGWNAGLEEAALRPPRDVPGGAYSKSGTL